MKEEIITIVKKPRIKNCVRIHSIDDIPDFLKDSVRIENDEVVLDCLEGEERVSLGSVIAYESLDNGKMNVWNKANWRETTKEVDGIFYEIPKPNLAIRLTDTLPQSILDSLDGKLSILPNGDFQLYTDCGILKCAPNHGYLVIYGKNEDEISANFLTKFTPSFYEYYVLDDDGNVIQSLEEYEQEIVEKEDKSSFTK